MKIRSDFVTNSSSSNYGTLNIKCKPLAEMMKNYEKLVEDLGSDSPFRWGLGFDAAAGTVTWHWDEIYVSTVPRCLDEVLASLCDGLAENAESFGADDDAPIAPFVRSVAENKEALKAAIKRVEWQETSQGWGGDNRDRYEQRNYSEEMLQKIKEDIAKAKGCTVAEVTERDFNEAVSPETSLDVLTFEYDAAKGIEKHERDFHFL